MTEPERWIFASVVTLIVFPWVWEFGLLTVRLWRKQVRWFLELEQKAHERNK